MATKEYLSVIAFIIFVSLLISITISTRFVSHFGDKYAANTSAEINVVMSTTAGGESLSDGAYICSGTTVSATSTRSSTFSITTPTANNFGVECADYSCTLDTTSALSSFPANIIWITKDQYDTNITYYSVYGSWCRTYTTTQPAHPLAPYLTEAKYYWVTEKGNGRAYVGLFCYESNTEVVYDGSAASVPFTPGVGSHSLHVDRIIGNCSVLARSYDTDGPTKDCVYSSNTFSNYRAQSSSISFSVISGPNLDKTSSSIPSPVMNGSTVSWSLTLTNNGDAVARINSASDISITNLTSISITSPSFPVTMASGSSLVISGTGTAPSSTGTYSVSASVTYNGTTSAIGTCDDSQIESYTIGSMEVTAKRPTSLEITLGASPSQLPNTTGGTTTASGRVGVRWSDGSISYLSEISVGVKLNEIPTITCTSTTSAGDYSCNLNIPAGTAGRSYTVNSSSSYTDSQSGVTVSNSTTTTLAIVYPTVVGITLLINPNQVSNITGGSILSSGRVNVTWSNGTTIQPSGQNVAVSIAALGVSCSNNTVTNGDYSCTFTVPPSAGGEYTVNASTNYYGVANSATTTLTLVYPATVGITLAIAPNQLSNLTGGNVTASGRVNVTLSNRSVTYPAGQTVVINVAKGGISYATCSNQTVAGGDYYCLFSMDPSPGGTYTVNSSTNYYGVANSTTTILTLVYPTLVGITLSISPTQLLNITGGNVTATGKVNVTWSNGTTIQPSGQNVSVNITALGINCSNSTIANGDYSCTFNVPPSAGGAYTVNASTNYYGVVNFTTVQLTLVYPTTALVSVFVSPKEVKRFTPTQIAGDGSASMVLSNGSVVPLPSGSVVSYNVRDSDRRVVTSGTTNIVGSAYSFTFTTEVGWGSGIYNVSVSSSPIAGTNSTTFSIAGPSSVKISLDLERTNIDWGEPEEKAKQIASGDVTFVWGDGTESPWGTTDVRINVTGPLNETYWNGTNKNGFYSETFSIYDWPEGKYNVTSSVFLDGKEYKSQTRNFGITAFPLVVDLRVSPVSIFRNSTFYESNVTVNVTISRNPKIGEISNANLTIRYFDLTTRDWISKWERKGDNPFISGGFFDEEETSEKEEIKIKDWASGVYFVKVEVYDKVKDEPKEDSKYFVIYDLVCGERA